MEKTLRVLGGDDDDEHGHSHSHSPQNTVSNGISSAVSRQSSADTIRPRKVKSIPSENGETQHEDEEEDEKKVVKTSKMSAYLNLFGDFVHNMYVVHSYC